MLPPPVPVLPYWKEARPLASPQLCGLLCAEQAFQVDQDEGSLCVDPASAGTSDITPRHHSKMTAPTSVQAHPGSPAPEAG